MMQTVKADVSLELANFILSAALEKARSPGVFANVAVVDAGAIGELSQLVGPLYKHLIFRRRMDHLRLDSRKRPRRGGGRAGAPGAASKSS
jgi:hypothetical protein